MEDDLERAVEIALRQDSDANMRQQAMTFCEQIKASTNGWQTCLALFIQQDRRTDNARFFALQVLEDALRLKSAQIGDANFDIIRQELSKWNNERITSSTALDPPFLRNKLAEIYSLLFVHLYTTTWTTFFTEFRQLMFNSNAVSSSSNPRAVDFFFRTCNAMEQEIADVLIVRSAEEAQRSAILKDEIRSRDMASLPETWFALFAQYQEADKGIVSLGLKVVAAWVSWIDISLIVNEPFMSFLFQLLQDSALRNPACEALVGIISKKMSSVDKVQLISMLNLPSLMQSLQSGIQDDPDFAENVARLVNSQCVELGKALTKNDLSPGTLASTTSMLYNLVPYVLSLLANAYDETSAAVFPAINEILTLIKRTNKQNESTQAILRSVLQAVILKMKYDESSDWGDEADAIEDAEFTELRVKLRSYQDIIVSIDFELYTRTVAELVTTTLDNLDKHGWRQVELAMYVLFLYGESLRSVKTLPRNAASREFGQQQLDAMLTKVVSSAVSKYPHPSIQDHFFEIAVRYSTFFEDRPSEMMAVLEAFIDQRGLHNTTAAVQHRSWYLFSRFVRSLSGRIGVANIGSQVLNAMQDLLIIPVSEPEDETDSSSDTGVSGKTDPFENRLYLFEAVGTLVSLKAIEANEQARLGSAILEPLFANIERNVSASTQTKESRLFLQHNIMAIGRFAQGFPSENKVKSIGTQWDPLFERASDYILAAFDAQINHSTIRDATRFAFARIVNIQDSRMALKMPRLVDGMIHKSDIGQLADFLPFLGQLVFKMKDTAHSFLNDSLSPLLTRIFQLLNTSVEGTDDALAVTELRRAYLMFVLVIFSNKLEDVFVSTKNQPAFEAYIGSIVHYASDTSDPSTQKLAFSVIREMIAAWCTSTRVALQGFDEFLYTTLLPLCFQVPAQKEFNLKDALTAQVVSEIATVQKQVYASVGEACIERYLTQASLQAQVIEDYMNALRTMDQKRFKAYFKQFCQVMY